MYYRKTPLLGPGIGSFSNANNYVFDELIAEIKQIQNLQSVIYKSNLALNYLHSKIRGLPVSIKEKTNYVGL